MKEMFKGVVNSPATTLSHNITKEMTSFQVEDVSVLPVVPNLLTIGAEVNNPETVKLIKINDGEIVVERGFEGIAKDWERLTTISRTLTAYDYNTTVENIEVLESAKVNKIDGKRLSTEDYTKEEKLEVAKIKNKPNKEDVYTKLQADDRIQSIIGTAPEALDTLAEIAIALNNDADFAGTVTRMLSEKVDKVTGKGLSTNDFTNIEKNKLSGIEENANKITLSASTSSASITTAATSSAVKTAYDRANEAFQSASNGKTDIASVIGSPASSINTFAQLKSHIQNTKDKGALNLRNKNVSALGTETLDVLMNKISNIQSGVKWAEGDVSTFSNIASLLYLGVSANGLWDMYDIQLTLPITFNPRILLLRNRSNTQYSALFNEENTDKTAFLPAFLLNTGSSTFFVTSGIRLTLRENKLCITGYSSTLGEGYIRVAKNQPPVITYGDQTKWVAVE